MRLKRSIVFIFIVLFLIFIISTNSFATTVEDAISAMGTMKDGGTVDGTVSTKLGPIFNAAIALIQITGTGISLIMVTILGIKYIMAAPSDKADVKKQITPMLIGCIVLFASTNLVQLIATFTKSTFGG